MIFKKIHLLAFLLGLFSILGQILLLRELITVFYGNETAYGIVLASWLFWVALGSASMAYVLPYTKDTKKIIVVFILALFLLLPCTMIMSRTIKLILNVQPGEMIGIFSMCMISFLLLAPLTFIFGGLFSCICRFAEEKKSSSQPSYQMGTIYLWESIGGAVGGFLFNFILVHFLSAMEIVFFIGLIEIMSLSFLYERNTKMFKTLCIFFSLLVIGVWGGGVRKLDLWTRQMQWRDFQLVTVTDSIYGNISLVKEQESYSLFENGLLSYSTKDDLSSEESVHYALLEHPQPQDVLFVGNGIGGSLKEILKYKDIAIDYIELDPKVVQISKNFLPSESTAELDDSRLHIEYSDARLWIKNTKKKYDVIIVHLPDPYTALINRYYTQDFFKEVKHVLHPQGIFSFSVTSSENFLNKETRAFLRSINSTLKSVFVDVQSIPGENNIFFVCQTRGIITMDPQILIQRLTDRLIETNYVNEYYLPFRMSPDRMQDINNILREPGTINLDIRPITYLYDIILWSTQFNLTFKSIFEKLQMVRIQHLLCVPLFLFIVGWNLRKKHSFLFIPLSVITTGFSEIIFQLIIILSFQILYGYAYYKIGMIISSFMLGLVLGSLWGRAIIKKQPHKSLQVYQWTQFGIFLYTLVLPIVIYVFKNIFIFTFLIGIFATTFALLPIIAGFMGGVQYPLAMHIVYKQSIGKNKRAFQSAGIIYALDVLGATGGAILTGTLFIPLLGINHLAFFCAAINGVIYILLRNIPIKDYS